MSSATSPDHRRPTEYYATLFTKVTWAEFVADGAGVAGFRESRRARATGLRREDVLLYYVTKAMLSVGAGLVRGPSGCTRRIWRQEEFPVRMDVQPLITLPIDRGVSLRSLQGKVSFYPAKPLKNYGGVLLASLTRLQSSVDGEAILQILRDRK